MDEQSANPKVWHIFYSYADEDEDLVRSVDRQLAPLCSANRITKAPRWEFLSGGDHQRAIRDDLARADMILLFVSTDYMSSSELRAEAEIAMQRSASDGVRVIPVLLRLVHWEQSPFGRLGPLPPNGKPVTRWRNREEALKLCYRCCLVTRSMLHRLM